MYKKILVAIDGSETSSDALEAAIQLARDSGAELQPLFVVDLPLMAYDVPTYDPTYVHNALLEEGRLVTMDAVERMRNAGVEGSSRTIETDPVGDDIANCILRAAAELPADVVVLGTHGRRGFKRMVLGSVAERFLRVARCPVLMISANCAKPVNGEKPPAP